MIIKRYIRQYRFHGHADCDGGSTFKIAYWNDSEWVDWVTGITGLNFQSFVNLGLTTGVVFAPVNVFPILLPPTKVSILEIPPVIPVAVPACKLIFT